MHHQRSAYSLRRLRMGAYHFLFNLILGIIVLAAVAYNAYYANEICLYYSLGGAAVLLLSMFVFATKATSLRCSLCMTPLWSGNKCQKHKNVKPALGVSYRLGLALSVIFKGGYRCPYCGEPFSAKKVKGVERRGR